MRQLWVAAALAAALLAQGPVARAAPCDISGPNLTVPLGTTCQLSGVHSFGSVLVDGTIEVNPYDGGDLEATGNLELRAATITINGTIIARARGYQTLLCGDGAAPAAAPAAGGAGGCAVRDSGGGGAHFGRGGRGTKDCSAGGCTFPLHWEEDCINSRSQTGNTVTCSNQSDCRNNDGLPATNGERFFHSIYEPDFGAGGGDKGCRDGDGRSLVTAGDGGGRIVLAANATGASTVTVNGVLDANGGRGCGDGNDSAGGGAGGTVFVVGSQVAIGPSAQISAAGGLGGDTRGTGAGGECPASGGYQQGSTCDDCGGGGGGGIVSILSGLSATIDDGARFDVSGAAGGTCAICSGEAGGGAGELQISGGYVGEFCDGFDNDFDDAIDEDLPPLVCGGVTQPSCVGGVPQACPAEVPACVGDVTDTRARFLVIVDSSGSMLNDLAGAPTYGDGSFEHPGVDRDGNLAFDDSRLSLAKGALSTVIAAYPEIDFALARYHQDQREDQSCQLASTFECQSLCCSYDDPRDNDGDVVCSLPGGAAGQLEIKRSSPSDDECINYAGNCGPPRRGADVLVGFGADVNQHLRWLDGHETNFIDDETVGDYCDFASGGDCELRGTGPTPLDNSLRAAQDFLTPIVTCDAAARHGDDGCRTYGIILLTDGAESCNGTPASTAAAIRAALDVDTYVIGFSVLASERAELNQIARQGSGNSRDAFLVGDEDGLANALATIVGESIVFEVCNGEDDDCDGRVDEGFAVGGACSDNEPGACRSTGTLVCNPAGDGVTCDDTADPGDQPSPEICNGLDDNCNGRIDEGLSCGEVCTPTGRDVCNGLDDDCNGAVDDDDPSVGMECGATDQGVCELGVWACIAGNLVCVGERGPDPLGERCNGLDDDCDGVGDDGAACPVDTACVEGACRVECGDDEFECPVGFECVTAPEGRYCVPTPCVACRAGEVCVDNQCVDPCAGVVCDDGETCRFGDCVDCYVTGCPTGDVCHGGACVPDTCAGVDCSTGCSAPGGCSCVEGACVANCRDQDCPAGQACDASGACAADACADVTCSLGRVCVDGACVVDPCETRNCPRGQACFGGACVVDGCDLVECSAGTTCEVVAADGSARCISPPLQPRELIYTGGGGCSTGAGGAGGGALLIALAALVLRRRGTR
jgi:hypothetical protein